MPEVTTPLLPAYQLQTHQRIAREAAKVPVTPDTIGPLSVLLAKSLVILHRDLLLACIDADIAGAHTDRDAREADLPSMP